MFPLRVKPYAPSTVLARSIAPALLVKALLFVKVMALLNVCALEVFTTAAPKLVAPVTAKLVSAVV